MSKGLAKSWNNCLENPPKLFTVGYPEFAMCWHSFSIS